MLALERGVLTCSSTMLGASPDMNEATTAALTIRLVNGRLLKFTFERQEDYVAATERVEKTLASQHVIIEIEDRVLLIPVHNILMVEISPPGKNFPAHAVRNARLRGTMEEALSPPMG